MNFHNSWRLELHQSNEIDDVLIDGIVGLSRASWWDTASPYHYVRLEDKGDDEILVVGGEDHVVGINPTDYQDAYGALEDWARAHWPAAQEVVYRWTGQVRVQLWDFEQTDS